MADDPKKKTKTLRVRVTPELEALIGEAAAIEFQDPSAWVRFVLAREARKAVRLANKEAD